MHPHAPRPGRSQTETVENALADLEAVMNAVPLPVFLSYDPEWRSIRGNRAAYALLRQEPGGNLSLFSLDGALLPHIRMMRNGVEVPGLDLPIRNVILTGQPVRNCELRVAFPDAPYVDLLGNIEPIFDANGRPRAAVAVFTDIIHQKASGTVLRGDAELLSVVLEATSEGVWDWNIQTGEAVFSPRYSTMLGYDPDEFARNYKLWRDLVHPDDVERVKQHHVDHFMGRTDFSIEFRMREKSGNWHWIHSRGLLIERDAEGKPLRMVGTHTSIQERKRAEEEKERLQHELAHAQKMESVGRLAGGIAHDFNNLMSVILLHCDSAIEELSSGESTMDSVKAIEQSARKAADVARQLLAFSHKQMLQTEVLDLNSLLAGSEKLVRRVIGEDIILEFLPNSKPCFVKADRGQLDQIVFNLVVNARDAMPNGGSLKIQTATVEMHEANVRVNPDAKPGPYVMLSVKDSGVGMDEETRSRAFEPFFTTKEVGRGTGLGLSVIYGIVKQSGGFIVLTTEPGHGAEFQIYLPAVMAAPGPVSEAEEGPIEGGSETVLLVEDETSLREIVSDILRTAGYKVLTASDGHEGLKLAFRDERPIDLLLTDVVMPRMSGPALVRRVQPVRQEMKVLYMSGYPDAGETTAIIHSGNFIPKPFTREKLLRRIRHVLGSHKD